MSFKKNDRADGIYGYIPKTYEKSRGATIEASDSIMYFLEVSSSLPQVIFSLGTAPE